MTLATVAFTGRFTGYPFPFCYATADQLGNALTTTKDETQLSPTPLTRLRAGLPGAMLAEFFGTFVLILLGLGTCALNVVGLSGSGRQVVPFGPSNWLINVFGGRSP